ncbi:(E)-4-hydroxy-3-methylbut-2-enyl-diphosphate synthase [candidate division KSB1 bacterium]
MDTISYKYCENLTGYQRRDSRIVNIGDFPLGGSYPIRIQSMTTTNTMDTASTVEESVRIIESGCEYVRITAPSIREAENLKNIKKELQNRGYRNPLIADIHFTPHAAETAAGIVEKVRINPGNYADRKKFKVIEYSDSEYNNEIERIYERFAPLVKICKENGTAMRIGTNHGSLSDRIMSRYGDTPLGMVESALEFIRICEDLNYYDIVLSMKSSNPIVMVQAYRLLVNKMDSENMNYPLHLGVTEAGEGEDGRIKSAIGIGTLLEDGLGDTIRVSLTEPPEFEAPFAKKLLERYDRHKNRERSEPVERPSVNPFEFNRRKSGKVLNFGVKEVPRVIVGSAEQKITNEMLESIGYKYDTENDKWIIDDSAVDYLFLGKKKEDLDLPLQLSVIEDNNREFNYQSFDGLNINELRKMSGKIVILEGTQDHSLRDFRAAIFKLIENGIELPVVVRLRYNIENNDDFLLNYSIDLGGLLVDGLCDGVWIEPVSEFTKRITFGILQAARARITKADFISCPSCGRTLFDLQETSAKIREETGHLKGIKIGIMGCIVNGPGEMADADYGYVGTGPGKVSLYRGKDQVKKNVHADTALKGLIDLIKKDGNWTEKPE